MSNQIVKVSGPNMSCFIACLLAPLLASCGSPQHAGLPETVLVPCGTLLMGARENEDVPRTVEIDFFRLGRFEVTKAEHELFLMAEGKSEHVSSAASVPCTGISHAEAMAYCRWLSKKKGRTVRLPTEAEWEYAARGGVQGAPYPWGWGAPEGRARFGRVGGLGSVGQFGANGYGLYDMAGSVFEWCAAPAGGERAPVRGGSWAERDPTMLHVYRSVLLPRSYRDADVGFRILEEIAP